MKPTQAHRVLRERVISENLENSKPLSLLPIVQQAGKDFHLRALPLLDSVSIPHKTSHTNLPSLSNNPSSDNLHKRIKELEKENFKLNHHVQQAEQTLRNYRNLLAKHNINPNEEVADSTLATPAISPRPPSKQNQDEELPRLMEELAISQKRVQVLEEENKALLRLVNDSNTKQGSTLQDLITRNESLQQGIRTRERKIQEMEQEVNQLRSESSTTKRKRQAMISLFEQVMSDYKRIKDEWTAFRSDSTAVINNFGLFVAGKQNHLQDLLRAYQKQFSPSKLKQQHQIIGQLQADLQKAISEANRLKAPATPAKAAMTSSTATSPLMTAGQPSPSKAIQALSQELLSVKEQLNEYCSHVENIGGAVHDLQVVHASEMKAVKHLAHVKDLKRVAKEREDLIDRERLHGEIKYLKDIQSLLIFALNTAEHSLNDVLPHVVVKLVESRERRMKQVELLYRSKMKDVEQRSLETCAVSSSQLEVFYNKAVENEKHAQEMAKEAQAKLAAALSSVAPAGVKKASEEQDGSKSDTMK